MKINFGEISIEKAEALTVYDAAAEAGIISRAVIAAKVNGSVCALNTEIKDGKLVVGIVVDLSAAV